MTADSKVPPAGLARRDLIGLSAGAALAAGLTAAAPAETAQRATTQPGPVPANAKPGRVAVEKRGAILLIGIDRVDAQNRMDPPITTGLGKAYYQLDHDDDLRVGILHGLGPDFSLGVDVPAFIAAAASGVLPPEDYIDPYGRRPPFRAKPVVVAVHGGVWSAAHELFLNADIRVAASDCTFNQDDVRRGAFPAGGATVRFTREAGWGNAMRYMLTGDTWGAEDARQMGLVHDITEPGKQLDRAIELAQKVAAAAPLGIRATLASAHQSLAGEEAALAASRTALLDIFKTEDLKEARKAAQEGRAPVFQGK